MTLTVEPYHLFLMGGALIAGFWALVKIIVAQFDGNLDIRFASQEELRTGAQVEWTRRFDEISGAQRESAAGLKGLETRFNAHLTKLPLEYWRREDAIRQEVTIVSRLDGLAGLVEQKFQKTDEKIEALRSSR